ncbi:hypothetical protein RCL_jg3933.t1 [Rhizophagus clarus]|uniref:Uncharacterized protein n=1 Tax=Rhizophagus clarus TaxID=94130 RepID=A0A8H3QC22_9GLOM|nr:hypothetical protein RCL_jg3933.t1 [Rhizophagus clarus]
MAKEYKILTLLPFILINNSKPPYYLPKIKEGQMLFITNSKFAIGSNGEIDFLLLKNYLYIKLKLELFRGDRRTVGSLYIRTYRKFETDSRYPYHITI